jgi:hypothetical protein
LIAAGKLYAADMGRLSQRSDGCRGGSTSTVENTQVGRLQMPQAPFVESNGRGKSMRLANLPARQALPTRDAQSTDIDGVETLIDSHAIQDSAIPKPSLNSVSHSLS